MIFAHFLQFYWRFQKTEWRTKKSIIFLVNILIDSSIKCQIEMSQTGFQGNLLDQQNLSRHWMSLVQPKVKEMQGILSEYEQKYSMAFRNCSRKNQRFMEYDPKKNQHVPMQSDKINTFLNCEAQIMKIFYHYKQQQVELWKQAYQAAFYKLNKTKLNEDRFDESLLEQRQQISKAPLPEILNKTYQVDSLISHIDAHLQKANSLRLTEELERVKQESKNTMERIKKSLDKVFDQFKQNELTIEAQKGRLLKFKAKNQKLEKEKAQNQSPPNNVNKQSSVKTGKKEVKDGKGKSKHQ